MRTEQPSVSAVDAARVRDALCEVIDPEIGINIVDLGLIYGVSVSGQRIRVRMTMTTPGSPMSGMIADEVEMAISHRFARHRINVDLVATPRWQANMMSPIARLELGLA